MFRRYRLLIAIVAGVLLGGIAVYLYRQRAEQTPVQAAVEPEAPPDLIKLRSVFTAGVNAVQRGDGGEAVKQLSSFEFGPRAVEEYRLYYLAHGHRLAGDANA